MFSNNLNSAEKNQSLIINYLARIGTFISNNQFVMNQKAVVSVDSINANVTVELKDNASLKVTGTIAKTAKIILSNNSMVLVDKKYKENILPDGDSFQEEEIGSNVIISTIKKENINDYNTQKNALLNSATFANIGKIQQMGHGGSFSTMTVNNSNSSSSSSHSASSSSHSQAAASAYANKMAAYGNRMAAYGKMMAAWGDQNNRHHPYQSSLSTGAYPRVNQNTFYSPPSNGIVNTGIISSIGGDNNVTSNSNYIISNNNDGTKITIKNTQTHETITIDGSILSMTDEKFQVDGKEYANWDDLKMEAAMQESRKLSM